MGQERRFELLVNTFFLASFLTHFLSFFFKCFDIALQFAKNKRIHGEAFNFGPNKNELITVEKLLLKVLAKWAGKWDLINQSDRKIESKILLLDNAKSKSMLNWKPIWDIDITIEKTVNWYKNRTQVLNNTYNDIISYEEDLSQKS
mgnify:CR=1 FL=1